MDPNMVAVKIGFNGELHRQRVHLETFSLRTLHQLFSETFHLVPQTFVVQYLDADGDVLNVCSDAEFVEACRVLLADKDDVAASSTGLPTLKFTAELRAEQDVSAAISASAPALPLADAVDRLAQSLSATLTQLQDEQWHGIEHATDALRQAARDTQLTLETVRRAPVDAPLDQVLGDSSDGLKSAARGISTFAQRLVSSLMPEKKAPTNGSVSAAGPVPVPVPGPAPVGAAPEVVVPPAPVPVPMPVPMTERATASESASETKTETETTAETATTTAPETPCVAFTDAEAKWAEQLTLIRSILPNVDTAVAVSVLERTDGNVEVSLNHLMEQV